jgi:type I restriction-modification system DNA methylase subunit
LTPPNFPRKLFVVPVETRKEKFFTKLTELVALAKDFPTADFDAAAPEETTKHKLIRPLLHSLGYEDANIIPEFKILGDQVDYLLKSDRPLLFLEAKSLIDSWSNLFEGHKSQVLRYLRNYRVSPEQAQMESPVTWLVVTNFKEWHLIRVTEEKPSFSFKLNELISQREKLWELLALENVEAGVIDDLYEQSHKADLDKRFLADLKRWRLIIANGFALQNQKRSVEEITLASQQLLDRFIFSRMLETHRLIEHNKLARGYSHYDEIFGSFEGKTFAEFLRESLFQEIKFKFNTELFQQPLLCDELKIDNLALATVIGHEPLHAELAAQSGIAVGQGEMFPFRHLYNYDFSKMSQDVMGAVYERFLAHKLFQSGGRIVIEDTDELRKKEGIYYTPQYIVDYIVAHTLGEKIKPILASALTLLGYKNYKGASTKIRELKEIKVLDPAMGSGSFLLRAFDQLVDVYDQYNRACRAAKSQNGNGSGMLFDSAAGIAEEIDHLGIRVATENIFGVDLDAQAVEVAKLNLWMRLMIVERDFIRAQLQARGKSARPMSFLPDLRSNLKRGNSLIADPAIAGDAAFDWEKEFPEIKGFDVVIGNPPYHMLQPHNTSEEMLAYLRQNFIKVEFKIDLFQLFLQRAVSFLKQGSRLGYIIPTSVLNNVYAESLRQWLTEQCCVEQIAVCRNQVFADADVHTSILIFKRESDATAREKHEILTTENFPEPSENRSTKYFRVRQSRFKEIPGHVWNILLNEENAGLITKLTSESVPLKAVATINRGLITGDRDRYFATTKKTDKYVPIIEGGDVDRYFATSPSNFVLFERPESAGGCWDEEVHFAEHKIVIRQIAEKPMAALLKNPLAVTGNIFTIRASELEDEFYLLGIINSRLTEFFWKTMFVDFKTSFPQVTVFSLDQLPIKQMKEKSKTDLVRKKNLVANVKEMLEAQNTLHKLPAVLRKKILHTQLRTPCNINHYLQKDFADALKPEILIKDVQQTGFIHEIKMESSGSQITLSAVVAQGSARVPRAESSVAPDSSNPQSKQSFRRDAENSVPEARAPIPILRMTFKHDALRQFIYAVLRQFLDDNSRKKKWTTGKKPEAIYPLIVHTLEPLVYFSASAGDNLRAIRDLMKSVAEESGSADLAALESEIKTHDAEIDARVYELYGLTPEEIKIVEA